MFSSCLPYNVNKSWNKLLLGRTLQCIKESSELNAFSLKMLFLLDFRLYRNVV